MKSIITLGRSISELESDDLVFVLFHGRNGRSEDMASVAVKLARSTDAILIPQAASGSWYPLLLDSPLDQNRPMLTQSLSRIEAMLNLLTTQRVTRDRVVLVGFSQGACLVTHFLMESPARYASAIIFSGGVLGNNDELTTPPGSLRQTPILLTCSRNDPYIRWSRVTKTVQVLQAMDAETTLLGYEESSHQITSSEYDAAAHILQLARHKRGCSDASL